jgi:hypothetical protein
MTAGGLAMILQKVQTQDLIDRGNDVFEESQKIVNGIST